MKNLLSIVLILFILISCSDDEAKFYEISLSSNIEDVTLEGKGIFEEGSLCTINAFSNDGKIFAGWYQADEYMYALPEYSFNIKGNTSLEARFCDKDENIYFQGHVLWSGQSGGFVELLKGYHPASIKKNDTFTFTWDEPNSGLRELSVNKIAGEGSVKLENYRNIVVTPTQTGTFIIKIHTYSNSNPHVLIKFEVID